jgi:hypothetical protein
MLDMIDPFADFVFTARLWIGVAALLLAGCSGSFEEARLVSRQTARASSDDGAFRARCRSIDTDRTWSGAAAVVFGACSAGNGVPAILDVVHDDGAQKALRITAIACGVSAAGAVYLRDSFGKTWVAEGCGQ